MAAERLVFVFQCYLDDSGTSGLPLMTLGGFTARLSTWERLEPVWDEILNRYGVPVLHTKQFHDTDGPYKKWSKIKKQTFTEELFSASHNMLLGTAIAVRKKSFETDKREARILHGTSAYGVCFSAIMFELVVGSSDFNADVRRRGVAFLLESGNKNNAEVQKAFDFWSKKQKFEGILRGISFVPKASCRAIQIADFFVFYMRRYLRDHDRFDGKVVLPVSHHLQIMRRHGPVFGGVASGRPKPLGSIDDVPDFDDVSFWGPDAAAQRRRSS